MSGLNKATVSAVVDDLIQEHLLQEVGPGESSLGRRPLLLDLNANGGFAIGADLGVDYLLVVAIDLRGRLVWKKRVIKPARTDPRDDLNQLAVLI
ncbi:MAG TPA: XylR family transcriptional regulator, partial [bacterium]|nr:XylR family transcriptional regulator [bacterium]